MSHVFHQDNLFDSIVLVGQNAYQKGYKEGSEGNVTPFMLGF
jgi:hypothetical protein